jgi:hypothetical protein
MRASLLLDHEESSNWSHAHTATKSARTNSHTTLRTRLQA